MNLHPLKKYILFSTFLAFMFITSGCAEAVGDFNLTQSEEEQIAGYCADMLLKYDKDHQSNVVDTSMARELQARVDAIKEMNAKKPEKEDTPSGNSSHKSKNSEAKDPYALSSEQNLAAVYGQEGFEVKYKGYEVCDAYPHDGSSSNFFAMEATMGKQLIVFHFDITNTTGESKECDFISQDAFYRVVVNDSERKNALTTILLNDLATVDETIAGGATMDAVVVLETDPGYENELSNLKLLAKYNGGEAVIGME